MKHGYKITILSLIIGLSACNSGGVNNSPTNSSTQNIEKLTVNNNSVNESATPQQYIDIQGGYLSFCAINNQNELFCWGSNEYGQLGIESSIQVMNIPTLAHMPNGVHVSFLSANTSSYCANSGDTLLCFGRGLNGELGDSSVNNSTKPVPVALDNNIKFTVIKSSHYSSCAISTESDVYCWGNNSYGQAGNTAAYDIQTYPVEIQFPDNSIKITTLEKTLDTVCAIATDNNVYCWGYGENGAIGDTKHSNTAIPQPIALPTDENTGKPVTFKFIKASYDTFCGVASDNNTYCWGSGVYGEIGNGSRLDATVPTKVIPKSAGVTFVQLIPSSYTFCGLTNDQYAYCWGDNRNYQAGVQQIDETYPAITKPTMMLSDSIGSSIKLKSLSTTNNTYCGLDANDMAYCWGLGIDGEIGNSQIHNNIAYETPVTMPASAEGFSQITGNDQTFCAIGNDQHIYCWGNGLYGQIGDGANQLKYVPTPVADSSKTE